MGFAQRLTDRYTYAEYATWPDEVRGELIDGAFYDMSAAPNIRHQVVAGRVYSQLDSALRGKPCRAFVAAVDVLLGIGRGNKRDEDATDVVQPDVLIVCDRNKIGEKYIRGAPDYVLEVLSPSTASKDQVKKLALYEREGVREFWTLDPVTRVLSIFVLGADGRYERPRIVVAEGKTALAILPDVVVDWTLAYEE